MQGDFYMSDLYRVSHSDDNANKSRHGVNAQISLESVLKRMQFLNYIKGYTSLKDWSKPEKKGYRLYAPFVITLFNNDKWALYSTTSYRSDRMKGNHWDSLLVKKYCNISKCYLIIENLKQSLSASCADANIADKDIKRIHMYEDAFDELDGALTSTSLYNLIETLYMKNQKYGIRESISGINFESRLAEILSYKDNLSVWQGNDLAIGMEYEIYAKLLTKWNCPHDIIDVYGTTKIQKLPSGGNPKTDVIAIIKYANGKEKHFTISCKKSDAKYVSAHQYNADSFIKTLNIKEESLKEHIRLFQQLGSEKKMREKDESLIETFTNELKPYLIRLCEWVLSGKYGEYTSDDQIAQYIFCFNKDSYTMKIFSINEYIQKMLDDSHGQFGTPFKWTYASKSLGKSIQLKMPTLKK